MDVMQLVERLRCELAQRGRPAAAGSRLVELMVAAAAQHGGLAGLWSPEHMLAHCLTCTYVPTYLHSPTRMTG